MYTPLYPALYTAVYGATLGAMNLSSRPFMPQTTTSYFADLAEISGAFAEAVESAWFASIGSGAGATLTQLDVTLLELGAEALWEVTPPQTQLPQRVQASTYATIALSLVTMALTARAYYAAQGIAPPALPSGGGSGGGTASWAAGPTSARPSLTFGSSTVDGQMYFDTNLLSPVWALTSATHPPSGAWYNAAGVQV